VIEMQWQVSSTYMRHPTAGGFTVHNYGEYATALRCYSLGKRLVTEWVGGVDTEDRPIQYSSVEAAQAACVQRIVEIGAGLPECTVASECLEACRPEVSL
jgi:hypothetical protein